MHKYLTTGKAKYFALYLFLYTSAVKTKQNKTKFPSTALQLINLKFMSTSAFHMMLQNSGMICHWKFKLLLRYHASKGDLNLSVSEVFPSLGFLPTAH